jgi:gliding motility-associated-like protein
MKTFRLSTIVFLLAFAKISFAQTASFTASYNGNTVSAPTAIQGCDPLIVQFQQTVPGGTTMTWDFQISTKSGNISDPLVDHPQVAFPAGNYTVRLTTSTGSTITMAVTVFTNPVANFTASPDLNLCVGEAVSFTNTSTPGTGGPITQNIWAFSNGTPNNSTSVSPTNIVYNIVGATNQVALTVRDANGCEGRAFQNVVVQQPTASFTGAPLNACAPPLAATFNSTTSTGNGLTYSWNFSGGIGSTTAQNPTVNFTSNGTFPVTLTVTDNFGCTANAGPLNVVIGKPTADFTLTNVCYGTGATFNNASSPDVNSWTYTFSDPMSGNNTNNNPTNTHFFSSPGTYNVKLVVSNGFGCMDSVTKSITVYPKPNAGFTTDTLRSCALPFNVTFTDTTTNATVTNWQWDPNFITYPLASPGGITNPFVNSYNSEGTFTVALVVTTNFGCKDTVIKTNLIQIQKPVAAISTTDTIRGCKDLNVIFNNNSTPGVGAPIVSSFWDFGITYITSDTLTTPGVMTTNYLYQDTGDFIVTLVVTNTYGCKDTTTFQYVEVGTHVHFDFDADIKEACFPMEENTFHYVNLDAPKMYADSLWWTYTPVVANPATITISTSTKPPGLVLDPIYIFQNKQTLPSDTGFIKVRLIVGFNGCNDTLIKPDFLYIHPPGVIFDPVANICNYDNHTVTFNNISKAVFANTTWHWDFGDSLTASTGPDTSNLANPSYTYTKPGTFTINLAGISTNTSPTSTYGPYGGPFSGAPYVFGGGTTPPVAGPPYTPYNLYTNYNTLSCRDTFFNIINVSDLSASFTKDTMEGCSPLLINFTGSSVDLMGPAGSATSWEWIWGDASGNGGGNPASHTYTTLVTTTYDAQLIATNQFGCKDTTLTQPIIVNAQPIANFVASDTSGCVPFPVTFTDLSTSNVGTTLVDWNWNFGTGATPPTSGIQGPVSVTYNTAASPTGSTIPVTLIVQDSKNCFSNPYTFYVEPTFPVAAFGASPEMCNGVSYSFNAGASDGVGLSYSWNFGDGTPVVNTASSSVSHTFNVTADTTTTVTLTVTDKNGCIHSVPQQIFISKPVANFSEEFSVTQCYPYFVDFHDLSTTDVNHPLTNWTFNYGDALSESFTSTATTDTVRHVYNNPGVYPVTLTVTNSLGCTSTLFKDTLIKVSFPVATFHYAPTSGFCAPDTVTFFIDNMINVDSLSWGFGDFGYSVDMNDTVQHVYTSGGSFIPYLYIVDSVGCDRYIIGSVPITPSGAIVNFTADQDTICGTAATAVNFTNISTNNGVTITSWTWDFGPNASPRTYTGQFPPAITYTGTGSDTVKLHVTSSTPGCGPFDMIIPNMITLLSNPPLNFTGNGASCPPLTVQFNLSPADTAGKGIDQFQWNFGNSTSSLLNDLAPSSTYTTSGIYYPSLHVEYLNGCDFDYPAIPDTVYPEPTADFAYVPLSSGFLFDNFQFTNTSLNFDPTSSKWNFGDSTGTFFVLNPAHKFMAEGNYPVRLIVNNSFGCIDTLIRIINVDYEIDIPNVFTPNGDGLNDFFTIKLPIDGTCVSLDIYDRWGIRMFSNPNFKNDWKGTDDSGNTLNPDTYYYIINYCESFTVHGWVYVQK